MHLAAWDEDGSSLGFLGTLVLLACFAACFLGIALIVSRVKNKKKARIRLARAPLGFTQQTRLPESLRAPVSAWKAAPATDQIFTGMYAGLPCALFEIDQGSGETTNWKTAIAVERSSVGSPLAAALRRIGAELDETSTPGWLIATLSGVDLEVTKLKSVLGLLTRETWTDALEERANHQV